MSKVAPMHVEESTGQYKPPVQEDQGATEHGAPVQMNEDIKMTEAQPYEDDDDDDTASDVPEEAPIIPPAPTEAEYNEATTESHAMDSPVSDTPVSDTPVSDTPVSDTPVTEAPVSEAALVAPVADETTKDIDAHEETPQAADEGVAGVTSVAVVDGPVVHGDETRDETGDETGDDNKDAVASAAFAGAVAGGAAVTAAIANEKEEEFEEETEGQTKETSETQEDPDTHEHVDLQPSPSDIALDPHVEADEYSQAEYDEYIKHPYFLINARKRHTLQTVDQIPKLTGLVPSSSELAKAVKQCESLYAKVQSRAKDLESKEQKKRAKQIKYIEDRLKKLEKTLMKQVKTEQKSLPATEKSTPLELTEEVRKRIFPTARRYDKEVTDHHLQNMAHIYSVRFIDCAPIYTLLHEAEFVALSKLEITETEEMKSKQKKELAELNKSRGMVNRVVGSKTDDFKVEEADLQHRHLEDLEKHKVEQEERRAQLKVAQKESLVALDESQKKFTEAIHLDNAV